MKQSKTTIKELQKRYRAVLIKCALINVALLFGMGTAGAAAISSGTYGDDELDYDEELTISGGTFNYTEISADGITVTGGKFNGASLDSNNSDMVLNGGTFTSETFGFGINTGTGATLTINSDAVSFAMPAGRGPAQINGGDALIITGDKGLSVINTQIETASLSGKITAGDNSFIGGFYSPMDEWILNGKKVYSLMDGEGPFGDVDVVIASLNEYPTAAFDHATITLNGNAKAGSGLNGWHLYQDAAGKSDLRAANWGLVSSLTQAQIDESVKAILKELKRVDAGSKDWMMSVLPLAMPVKSLVQTIHAIQGIILGKPLMNTLNSHGKTVNLLTGLWSKLHYVRLIAFITPH